MRIVKSILFTCSLLSAAVTATSQPRYSTDGAYLVELHDGQDADEFLEDLRSSGLRVQRRRKLSYRLFNGVSFHVLNATTSENVLMKRLASPSGAKNVWPLYTIPLPESNIITTSLGEPGDTAQSTHRRDDLDAGFSPHVMTQIDKLHEAGYTGKNIRVGIIDTGVDYTHPALGGCFGEGCLIAYGADLVGDMYDWDNPAAEDGDPMEAACPGSYGHGTHVAGIIAAQPNEHGFVGAAPGATLGVYKMCGGVPFLGADLLIDAMNRAVEDGSDVISMSIGLPTNIANDPAAFMASRIVEDGTPFVVAASNAGGFSTFWSVTSPCVGSLVTCVGAVVPEKIPLFLLDGSYTIDDGPEEHFGRIKLPYNAPADFSSNVTLPVWDADSELGSDTAACTTLPDDTVDLTDRLVLVGMGDPYRIRDSSCLPAAMVPNLVEKGARYIMFYPRKVGNSRSISVGGVPEGISVGILPTHHAAIWREAIQEGKVVNVSIVEADSATEHLEFVPNDDNGGAVASFSSWGPSGDMELNPQVVAPGDFYLSTYPVKAGGYTVMGGTSMAAPLVAGLYALLMEARQTKDPLELLSIISSTAKHLAWFDNESLKDDVPALVAQQGAGLVQGLLASRATATLNPVSLSFNDTASCHGRHEFIVRNSGEEESTYRLSHVPGPAAHALGDENELPETPVTIRPFEAAARLVFDPDTITLAPGEAAKVTIRGVAPSGPDLDETRLPIYGGWVQLQEGSNNETLSIPYVGLAARLGDIPALLPGAGGGTRFETWGNGSEIEVNTTFIVPRPEPGKRAGWFVNPRVGDPAYTILPRTPAQVLRVDIVALDEVHLPTEDHLGYQVVGSTIDILGPFPVEGPVRAPFSSRFAGILWSGEVVPEGRYQIVVSALRVYGDVEREEDWDVVESSPFILEYTDVVNTTML